MTETWAQKKVQFQARFDTLNNDASDSKIDDIIAQLNLKTANYISKGGLSQNASVNTDYTGIIALAQDAENFKRRYTTLNNDILNFVKQETTNNNITTLINKTGTLQQEINGLQMIQDEIKTDVETAVARDELLRSRETNLNTHQLFILDRPVRRNMIPYLWVLSIVFVGIGLVLLRMIQPVLGITNDEIAGVSGSFWYMLTSFFTNNITWIAIIGACMVVILILGLKIGGVFG